MAATKQSKTAILHAAIDRRVRDRFTGLCRMQGRKVQEVLEELLRQWVSTEAGATRWGSLVEK